jgi:hypothetical protein
MDTSQLVDRLTKEAQSEGITNDAQLARKLGLTQPALTHLRVDRRGAGRRVLGRILNEFPTLTNDVNQYMKDNC